MSRISMPPGLLRRPYSLTYKKHAKYVVDSAPNFSLILGRKRVRSLRLGIALSAFFVLFSAASSTAALACLKPS